MLQLHLRSGFYTYSKHGSVVVEQCIVCLRNADPDWAAYVPLEGRLDRFSTVVADWAEEGYQVVAVSWSNKTGPPSVPKLPVAPEE